MSGRPTCTAIRMNPAAFAATPGACAPGAQGAAGPDRITTNSYDAAGQRLQLREAVGTADEGTEASWSYSPNGQVTAVIDGNGNRAELIWDGFDRQRRWIFPSPTLIGQANQGDYEEYAYDAAGNRTSLRRRDGRSVAFAYDALNRVTARTYPQGGARPVFYAYNLMGNQTRARFDTIEGEGITNAWDGFGRLTSSTTTMGGTARMLAYLYDAAGNRIRITHPDLPPNPVWFSTDYDALGRPVMLWANGVTAMASMGYYPHGGPAGRSLANGATSEWGYDGIQRVAAVVQNAAGTSGDLFLSLSYNPAGQIASRTLSNDSYAWTRHYAVNRNYTTNGLNQYIAAGGPTISYDPNGNLTSDGVRTYGYDIENRLVSMSNGAALSYDPLGRLFQVTLG
jgi:YD repeat-containing protein